MAAAPGTTDVTSAEPASIYVEAVITGLTTEDEDAFREHLVPWRADTSTVVESVAEDQDAFEGAIAAIRVAFEAWYDTAEDDCLYDTYFVTSPAIPRDERPRLFRDHKRCRWGKARTATSDKPLYVVYDPTGSTRSAGSSGTRLASRTP